MTDDLYVGTAASAGGWRRFVLALMIVLCVALPRAGVVMSGLRLPLPFSYLFLHLVFLFMVFALPVPEHVWRLFPAAAGYLASLVLATLLGLWRDASLRFIVIDAATLLGPMPAFFLVVWLIRDERDAKAAMRWLVLSVLAASTYGIAQLYLGRGSLVRGLTYTAGTDYSMVHVGYEVPRVLSSYGDPNVFAGALVLFLPVMIGALTAPARAPGVPVGLPWLIAVTASGAAALVFTSSRAGFLGAIMAAGVLAWRFPGRLPRIVLLAGLLTWLASEVGIVERILYRLPVPGGDPRRVYGAVTLQLLGSHPEGAGLGIHPSVNPVLGWSTRLAPATSVWQSYNSFYLHLLARAGVLGLFTFLWATLRYALLAWRSSRVPECPAEWQPIIVGFIAGFLGVQLAMAFNPFYLLPGGGVNLWLALGLACGIGRVVASASGELVGETA